MFDLDRGEDLIGITSYCVHPADRVGAVEKVGGTKDPDIGRIIELAPDVVLVNEEENRREDADGLAEAGIELHASFPRRVEDTAAMVRSIGERLERNELAESIAADIETRAQRVRDAARGQGTVRWAYLIWRKPWMTVNADTFVDALLGLAGGVNVFAERAERYPEISLAELREAKPDVVFASTEPFPFEPKHLDELTEATGMPREAFRIADGEYLSWHGSRTPDGIDYAARCIASAREVAGY